jgi:hypothetical protein
MLREMRQNIVKNSTKEEHKPKYIHFLNSLNNTKSAGYSKGKCGLFWAIHVGKGKVHLCEVVSCNLLDNNWSPNVCSYFYIVSSDVSCD